MNGISTSSGMPSVRTWSQPRPLRLPVSHTTARWASNSSARVSRYWVTACSIAADPDADEDERGTATCRGAPGDR